MTGHKVKRDAPETAAKITAGAVVRSVSGRDRNRVYVVMAVEGSGKRTLLLLADGTKRTKPSPKRKNPAHVRYLGTPEDSDINDLLNHPTDGRIAELCNRFD